MKTLTMITIALLVGFIWALASAAISYKHVGRSLSARSATLRMFGAFAIGACATYFMLYALG